MAELFILFIIYSFMGWILEVLDIKIENGKWVNRGMLMGPVCPIYGVCCILIIILLKKYVYDPLVFFIIASLLCGIVEYLTSFLLEKIFKLRWWDYSNRLFNINGRVCLINMILFGLMCTAMMYYINPFISNLVEMMPIITLNITASVIGVLFVLDILISFNVLFNLKNITKNIKKDSTEEIRKAVKKFVEKNIALHKRIVNAFPQIHKIIAKKKSRK
jgi:uncharacterized membrane protein